MRTVARVECSSVGETEYSQTTRLVDLKQLAWRNWRNVQLGSCPTYHAKRHRAHRRAVRTLLRIMPVRRAGQ